MRYATYLGALSFLCLISIQHVHAQSAASVASKSAADGAGAAQTTGPRIDRAERCSSLPVEVIASSEDERDLVCSAVAVTLGLLDRCGIGLKRTLHVEVMSEVRHPRGGTIFGMFDVARDRVLIAEEASIPALVKDTPYAALPRRDFYKSLVVHETVHGVMHQNLKRKATTHAAYEYPAYALQIESLPSDVRQAFLNSYDQVALGSNALFSDSVLFFDPYFFAARAFHHYRNASDPCSHLTSLLSGDVAFIAPPM